MTARRRETPHLRGALVRLYLPGLLSLLLGPTGVLAFALLALYAFIWGGQIVSGKTHQKVEVRAEKPEEAELYAGQVADLRVALARAEERLRVRLALAARPPGPGSS
jgi:hypothetical protein